MIREDGKYMSEYQFNIEGSNQSAHFIIDDKQNSLTAFKSFYFHVPEGLHYYSFKTEEYDNILIKLESYK